MRIGNIIKSVFCLAVVLLLISSCGSKSGPTRKNIICLVDFSDSKNAAERLQFYMTVIKDNVIPKLSFTDKITVIPIDRASITNSSDILLADLSTKDFEPDAASPMEEEQITKDNLKRFTDSLATSFAQTFQSAIDNRNKTSHGTDIFGALEVVKGKLKAKDDNVIILLSDMMNYTNTLKMEPENTEFSTSTLNNALGKVPNFEMANTTVLVLTADQSHISREHFKLVQSFWMQYFEKNHIKLYDYNSASLSKLNELMALPHLNKF